MVDPEFTSDNQQGRSENWCATVPTFNVNKADQAPLSSTDDMATLQEKYHCVTQASVDTTEDIVVGMGPLIPRWQASKSDPTELLYFVIRDGFASDEDFDDAASAFQQAADDWNALAFGVKITRTMDQNQAHFVVRYFMPDEDQGVLASAFFPNNVQDVLIYDRSLTSDSGKRSLKSILLHEIGHIIGLRHEFAITGKGAPSGRPERDAPAKQFGSQNANSVMAYVFPPTMQETDKHDVKEFYKLSNGFMIDGVRVTDFVPRPLEQIA
jgi:hypothetical protein